MTNINKQSSASVTFLVLPSRKSNDSKTSAEVEVSWRTTAKEDEDIKGTRRADLKGGLPELSWHLAGAFGFLLYLQLLRGTGGKVVYVPGNAPCFRSNTTGDVLDNNNIGRFTQENTPVS